MKGLSGEFSDKLGELIHSNGAFRTQSNIWYDAFWEIS